jgi:hypothetical protein
MELRAIPGGTGTVVRMPAPSVPLSESAGRTLPWLLAASSAASVAALLGMVDLTSRERRTLERFALLFGVAEVGAAAIVEYDAHRVPRASRALRHGLSGALWNAASVATAGAMILAALPGSGRRKRLATAALGLAGSACLRLGVLSMS